MRVSTSLVLTTAGVLMLVGAFACGSSTNNPASPSQNGASSGSSSSGGGASAAATGTLAIHLTDSPFSDAKALLVTFSDASVHNADTGEWTTVLSTSRTCDLKQLNGPTDVLGVGKLAAGHYTQIRLTVTSADLYFDDAKIGGAASAGPCAPSITVPIGWTNAPVTIPSGEVKLNNEFTVPAAGATTITLDFDGDQSVRQTGSQNGRGNSPGGYMMTPVIRVLSVQ